MLTPEQRTEMRRLERNLAYDAARSDVECRCTPVGDWRERWYDPARIRGLGEAQAIEDRDAADRALRYLDLRGLLERHPSQPWVRVREGDAPC